MYIYIYEGWGGFAVSKVFTEATVPYAPKSARSLGYFYHIMVYYIVVCCIILYHISILVYIYIYIYREREKEI